MTSSPRPKMGCGYAVCGVLALFGAALLFVGQRTGREEGKPGATGVMVVGGLLLVSPLALVPAMRRAVRRHEREEAIRREFPESPWKWKPEWRGAAIAPVGVTALRLVWLFAVGWTALSVPLSLQLWDDPKRQREPLLNVLFVFPLIGVGALGYAGYATVRRYRYGLPRFVPATMPGVIGGFLGGSVEVPRRVHPRGDARLVLRCVRRRVVGTGKSARLDDTELWARTERLARERWQEGPGGASVPVLFSVPTDALASDDRDPHNRVIWQLAAHAPAPGIDLDVAFEVPVFATGELAPPPAAERSLLADYRPPVAETIDLAGAGVIETVEGFRFASTHLVGTRWAMTVLAAAPPAVLWWAPLPSGAAWLAWVAGAVFTLVLGTIAADLWWSRQELRVEGGDVVATKTRPWGRREWRVPRAAVADVVHAEALRVGERRFHRLQLVGTGGADPERPGPAEPMGLRRARRELARARGGTGDVTAAQARLVAQPRFVVTIAKHVPGPAIARKLAARVLNRIRQR
jgi:hypothetical protein